MKYIIILVAAAIAAASVHPCSARFYTALKLDSVISEQIDSVEVRVLVLDNRHDYPEVNGTVLILTDLLEPTRDISPLPAILVGAISPTFEIDAVIIVTNYREDMWRWWECHNAYTKWIEGNIITRSLIERDFLEQAHSEASYPDEGY